MVLGNDNRPHVFIVSAPGLTLATGYVFSSFLFVLFFLMREIIATYAKAKVIYWRPRGKMFSVQKEKYEKISKSE